jgi:hypothetical protein
MFTKILIATRGVRATSALAAATDCLGAGAAAAARAGN